MNRTPRSITTMNTANSTYSRTTAEAQGCHCAPSWSSPCGLTSFQRPNYFYGYLLTDSDLTQEQLYFREKTRLYHRTLDGHGIVCGLRLTCDHNCSGKVLVGRGYAIDQCGNDLIVAQSASVDVISQLIDKGLIPQDPIPDPCKPETERSECHFRQCFYVTIRYQEQETDFASPLVTGCQSTASDCEPTRISETITFDVVDKLPPEENRESSLKRRLESSFKIFSEGPFARALQKHKELLREIVEAKASKQGLEEYQKVFFELRGLLLLYFNQCPDRYNCTIGDQIRNICFPEIHKRQRKDDPYLEEVRDAFSSLLALAWQHAVSAALGELVPSCHEACEAGAIYLGTVVVENGRVVRVCNCPRSYVWSWANLPEVLLANVLGGLACEKELESKPDDERPTEKEICCRDFDFDLDCFLRWLHLNENAPYYAGTELVRWLETLRESFRDGFDFTNPCNFSSRIFEGMDDKKVTDFLKGAEVKSRVVEAPLAARAPDLVSLMQMAGLATGQEPIVIATKEGVVSTASAEHHEMLAQIHHLQNQIGNLKAQVERLQAQRPQSS
jgi:hypothetical protein